MAKITVYTKPSCVQCGAVKRWLDKRGLEYETVDLPSNPDKLEEFKALGIMAAPITVVDDHEPIPGFNPILLDEYINGVVPAPATLYRES